LKTEVLVIKQFIAVTMTQKWKPPSNSLIRINVISASNDIIKVGQFQVRQWVWSFKEQRTPYYSDVIN